MQTNQLVKFAYRDLHLNQVLVHQELEIGTHQGTHLSLGSLEIPDREIRFVRTSGNELHLGWQDSQGQPQVASMIVDRELRTIVDAIHYGYSRRVFEQQLAEAAERGLGHQCRDSVCPFCQAKTLTLDSYPWSPQVHCRFCDSIHTTVAVDGIGQTEKDYRICPKCHMYSRPRRFTIGYFWFVWFHAQVNHRVILCCNDCMRPEAWKMTMGNLPGVLGMPLALTQLSRVYRDAIKKGPFQGLDKGNRLLKRGEVEKALEHYSIIVEKHPFSAGVLYNVARGLLARGDQIHAEETLVLALQNCVNYQPAERLLAELRAEMEVT